MKPGAVLVNTARGELADVPAIPELSIPGNSAATGRTSFGMVALLGKQFATLDEVPNAEARQLMAAYPRYWSRRTLGPTRNRPSSI